MASDEPEGWDFYNSTVAHAAGDPGRPRPQQLQQRRGGRGQRLPGGWPTWSSRRHARGLRARGRPRRSGGAPVQRRRRRRHPAAGRGRRLAALVEVARGVRGAHTGDHWATRARQGAGAPGQGAGAQHYLMPRYLRDYLRICPRIRSMSMSEQPPLVLVSNRGPVTYQEDGSVKRGTGGLVTALTGLASHRDAIWIASAMTDQRRRGRPRARRAALRGRGSRGRLLPRAPRRVRRRTPTTASTTSSPTRCSGSSSTTCGT